MCPRPVDTGVQNDARVHGPWTWPEITAWWTRVLVCTELKTQRPVSGHPILLKLSYSSV